VVIKRYKVILTLSLLLPASVAAADNQCMDKTCVDVFTQDNQLIITAAKNGVKPTKATIKKVVVSQSLRRVKKLCQSQVLSQLLKRLCK